MSAYNEIDRVCDRCGEEFKTAVWTAVHAGQDPELKELLLGGELNLIICPACKDTTVHQGFLLYQEPALELVLYVYPENEKPREEELRRMMLAAFRDAQATFVAKERLKSEPELLFGLDALAKRLTDEEEIEEQTAIAESYCRDGSIPTLRLSRTQARQQGLLPLMPAATPNDASPQSLTTGLTRLLSLDPALTLYQDQLKKHQA